MKKAFTLIEVNLAILVMAGGILSVVVLYSLGFRELRQSREDIVSAGFADAAFGPLIGALSSSELTWSDFNTLRNLDGSANSSSGTFNLPANGWGDFVDKSTGKCMLNTAAEAIFSKFSVPNAINGLPSGYVGGMVISHERGSGVVKIGFRAAKRADALLSAPLYYTEVRFQGQQDNL